jgi:hypothetical protein
VKDFDPLVPQQYDMPALISQRLKTVKQHAEVPDATDAIATMKYWDEYRRKERLRIAGLGITPDEGGLVTPEQLAQIGLIIGEAPTTANLLEREITNHLEDIYKNGGSPDMVLLTPECAFENGVIGIWRFRWLKLQQRIRGIWSRKGSSGGASAPPTGGTTPTGA